jgi:hypothetical protein
MKSRENRAKDLPGSFTENLCVIAEGDASAFKFLLTLSACISRCIPFLCLYFGLFFFVSLLCFQNNVSTLSRPVFSLVFLRSELVREAYFWYASSGDEPKSSCVLLVFLFFPVSFVSLSLTNPCFFCAHLLI